MADLPIRSDQNRLMIHLVRMARPMTIHGLEFIPM